MIELIPAIDIIDGKCVRLTQGDYATKKVYNEDPLEVAKMFEGNGIRRLHVVDLDGAREGRIINYRILERIATRTSLIIDFGGGLKQEDDLEIAFESGAQMVTGGSIAVKNPEMFTSWISTYRRRKTRAPSRDDRSRCRARRAADGEDLETQTAVRCKRKEKTTISYTDSLFMKKATALKPVIYRKNKNIEDNIELQAFMQIPLSFVLKRADSILLFLLFYGLFVGILYGSYKWGIKKLNAVLLEKKVVETKIVEKPVVAFVRSFSKEGTLPFGLQFDKKSGILKYKNLHVTLSGQGLKLFTHLINSQQSVIAPQIIYSQILGNALKKEKIGKAERDAVSAAIVRLRESLAPMPFIQIKSCRGTGYQLIISNPEEI